MQMMIDAIPFGGPIVWLVAIIGSVILADRKDRSKWLALITAIVSIGLGFFVLLALPPKGMKWFDWYPGRALGYKEWRD